VRRKSFSDRHSILKVGRVVLILGVITTVLGLNIDVRKGAEGNGYVATIQREGRLQNRLLATMVGLTLVLVGTILMVGQAVCESRKDA
jgi:hypothetical protein